MRETGRFSGPETLEQSGQHFLNFEKLALSFFMLPNFEQFEISREQKKILKFTGRAHGNIKKLAKFGTASAAAAFRDVRGNRAGRAANLATQAESFVRRKFTGEIVRLKGQSMTPAPNVQLAKVLHDLTLPNRFKLLQSYLQLTTNNCQLCEAGG